MVGPESIDCIYVREKERKRFLEFIYPAPLKNTCVKNWAESIDGIKLDYFTATLLGRVLPPKI